MHEDMECGLLQPQDLPVLAGYTCAPAGHAFPFPLAHRGYSSPSSAPSSPQLTYKHHANSTQKQRVPPLSAWSSSSGHIIEKKRDTLLSGEGTYIRGTCSLSADVYEHMKNEFSQSSATDKRVVVRIRGTSFNSGRKLALCVHPKDDAKILCDRGTCLQEFQFSRVFADPDTNEDVYRDIGGDRIVVAVGRGIKETILAYGQTGSGKTHSLFGTGQEKGLTQFFIKSLFGWRSAAGLEQTISLCVVEVLGDMLYDLLPDWDSTPESGSPPEIRWEECFIKTGKYKYKVITVDDERAALRILEEARQQRKVGGSHLNARSSRSHAIVQFFVHTRFSEDQAGKAVHSHVHPGTGAGGYAFYGVLTLADLAGCERELPSYLPRNLTSAAGAMPKNEGKWGGCSRALNTSISALNRLIRKMQTGALDESDRRQSALNRVLFDYLQPECGVCMLFCLNPEASELQVSLSTLTIASDCRLIPCSRKQHLLRLEPFRTLCTYNVLCGPTDSIRCLVQARDSAGAPVCMSQGMPCVKGKGGRQISQKNGVTQDQGSSAETFNAEHTHGDTLQCRAPEKLISCVATSPAQGDVVSQNTSERTISLVAQTRETQTDERLFCPQSFATLACDIKNHSCRSINGNIEASDQSHSVRLNPLSHSRGAQTSAAVMPLSTADTSEAGTSENSGQYEAAWQNGMTCLHCCTSKDCVPFHRGRKMVPGSQRGKCQKHVACYSASPRHETLLAREEEDRGDSVRRPTPSSLPSDSQGEETRDCDYLGVEQKPACTACSRITDDGRRTKRRHRRCRKHTKTGQLQICALHHLCQQQQEEIQAEIQYIEKKLTTLMQLCTSERASSRAARRASGPKLTYSKASSTGRARREASLLCPPEGRPLVTQCGSDEFLTTADELDRGGDRRSSHSQEDPYRQRVGECGQAVRKALDRAIEEDEGAPVIGRDRLNGSGSQATASCDLVEKEKGGSPTAEHGQVTMACVAVSRTARCGHKESLDAKFGRRQSVSDHLFLRGATSVDEFRGVSPGPAPRARMSEEETSSARTGTRRGAALRETRKYPTAFQARPYIEVSQKSSSQPLPSSTLAPLPERHLPKFRNNSMPPSIRHSEHSAQYGGKASSGRMENLRAETRLRGDIDDEEETHYLSERSEQRNPSHTSEALTPQQTIKQSTPKPLNAEQGQFFRETSEHGKSKLGVTQNGCNKGDTLASSVGLEASNYHRTVSDVDWQVAVPCSSLSSIRRSFSCECAPAVVRSSKPALQGVNLGSCVQRPQNENDRRYRLQAPFQFTCRQANVREVCETEGAGTNHCEWNECLNAGPETQLNTPEKRERLQTHEWHRQTEDLGVTPSGLCPLMSTRPLSAMPTSIFPLRQPENTCDDLRIPPVSQRSRVGELLPTNVYPMKHTKKHGHVKEQTCTHDVNERRRLQQRLRVLLHLRQQRRWPQLEATRQVNSCAAEKPAAAPRKDIHKHAEDSIQEELEQIIQHLHRLRLHQEHECPKERVPTSNIYAGSPHPCDATFELPSIMQPAFWGRPCAAAEEAQA